MIILLEFVIKKNSREDKLYLVSSLEGDKEEGRKITKHFRLKSKKEGTLNSEGLQAKHMADKQPQVDK